jgi:serine/threonine-protein kinase
MVMDYLDGESFATYVRGAFPTEEVVHLVVMALRGLVAVHTAGIVHRDLKPDNIFLVRDGSGVYPKLLDFGISKQTDHSQSKRSAVTTQQGVLLGTPAYMSPEQARGLKDIDHRTDIYSMGVLLYEALSGQLPFDAEHIGDLMVKVISATPTHLSALCPELPKALCDVVMKAIARDREVRFQSAEDLRVALLAAVGNEQLAMLSERPTPPPGKHDYSGGLGSLASSVPTLVTADSLAPLPRTPQQTLDGTSVDIALDPSAEHSQRRKLMMGGFAAGLLVIALGIALLLRETEPSDVVVSPLPVLERGAAAAPVTEVKPVVEAAPVTEVKPVVEAAPAVEAKPVVEVPDASVQKEPAPRAPEIKPARVTARVQNRAPSKAPAKTTKTKSGVLTELDY